ncbi:Zinc finger, CCHC-type [Phaffia rhodozyma]|uniref:Zinc finger, CCHC-type n=1 Tax=Phaffia rhodozyma TaxID=264483 RepID=A0A0F7SPK6_PHARH|nr:Zinc finger, CCHC-type [Phaffia rhodozyma]
MSNATNSTRIAQLEAKVLALQSELAERSNEPTISAPPLFDGRDPSACREFSTRSVYEYYVEFISLVAFTGWNDDWLISQFYSGLKPRIKDRIDFLKRPDTLEELRNLATQIDERFYEREKKLKGEGTQSTIPHRPFLLDDEKPPWITPADRPAVHADPPDGSIMIDIDNLSSPRGPLTAQERDRRRELNLCLYCGQPGHIRINCPVLDAQKHVRQVRDIESFCQAVLKNAAETQEGYDDPNGSAAPDFKPGDLVLYKQIVTKTYGPNDKLDYKVLGPFKILEPVGRAAFRLDFPATMDRHPVIHVSQLERYHQNEPSAQQVTSPPAEKSLKTKARGMRPKKS